MLIGYNAINISSKEILMSTSIMAESGSFSSWHVGRASRVCGDNGGGAYCNAIVSCDTDSSVKLLGYGYNNGIYKYNGNLIAVQLC